MGMVVCITGFRPPNEKWKEMKKVWDVCQEAKIDAPKEVWDFFNGGYPDDSGVEIDLEKEECTEEWSREMEQGFQVDLTKLPKDLRYIRFYNSY